jgi:general secretion pathway protein J
VTTVSQGEIKRSGQRVQKSGDAKGFTLLEILLAFFIFAIIFGIIYSSYSASFKTITNTEGRMELYRKAAIALERISEDIEASYISVPSAGESGQPAENTQFVGINEEINGQDADSLHLFTRIPPLFDNEMETASGSLVAYDVKEGSIENELVLMRSEKPEFNDETGEEDGLVLCDGLQGINFTYFDANGDVHDSWDSNSDDFNAYLPRMVTISLAFLNSEDMENPFKFTTSINLPLKSLKTL